MIVYEIAFNLGKTVREIADLSYEEFLGWVDYFERRPVGWRSDDRTFKLLQAQGIKKSPWEIFVTLGPIYNPTETSLKPADGYISVNNLKRSTMFSKMLSAKGGDEISL